MRTALKHLKNGEPDSMDLEVPLKAAKKVCKVKLQLIYRNEEMAWEVKERAAREEREKSLLKLSFNRKSGGDAEKAKGRGAARKGCCVVC